MSDSKPFLTIGDRTITRQQLNELDDLVEEGHTNAAITLNPSCSMNKRALVVEDFPRTGWTAFLSPSRPSPNSTASSPRSMS